MGRSHDVLISEFDLDRLEADLAAAERAAAEQTTRANENHAWALRAERERDEARERADTMFAKHAEILDQYRRERDSECALADRLAEALTPMAWLAGIKTPNSAEEVLSAWKEARND